MSCDPAASQYGSKAASDRMLRGRSPWGLGGAVYLLVRLFIHSRCLSVDVRSSMLSIGGRGTLDSVYIRGLHRVGIGEQ